MALGADLTFPLLIASGVLVLTCVVIHILRQNRKLPPGPWGLPFFGYYPFLSDTPHRELTKLSKVYGNVFSFRTLGGTPVIVLNGAKTIKDVLINRSEEFIGRPLAHNFVTWMSDGLGITQEEGLAWKEQRHFFLRTAKNVGFGKTEIENQILDEIRDLLEALRKIGGKPTDLKFHVAHVVNSVVSQVLFSNKLGKNDAFLDMTKWFQYFMSTSGNSRHLLVGTMYDLLSSSPRMRREKKGKVILHKIVNGFVEEHIRSFDPNNPRDYMDAYLQHRNQLLKSGKLDESTFTKERLLGLSMNFFVEGTESVTSTIVGLLHELSKHPEEQKVAQKELDSVIGRDRTPSWTDRKDLPYVEATIEELYRLAASFNVSTQYSNFEETEIDGCRIPRRSVIVANYWSINMDPVMYPEPEKFDPRRFLNDQGKRIKLEGPYPFGLGKRSCVGESLAQMEVFLIIVSLIQHFDILPGEDTDTVRLVPRE